MEINYPSNSHPKPTRSEPVAPEPKKIQRVVSGTVVQRKKPILSKLRDSLLPTEGAGVVDYVLFDILIPGARVMLFDAATGGLQRKLWGEDFRSSPRGGGRGPVAHTPYNRMSSAAPQSRYAEPRREMSQRGRALHEFQEIILPERYEAEEVLRRMDELCVRYDGASVADLYNLVGVTPGYTDEKWGWLDMRGSNVQRIRNGYLLNLPKPEPLD